MNTERTPTPSSAVRDLRAAIDAALVARDKPAAVTAAMDALRSGAITVPDLYTRVLSPLLVDTGSRWQTGEVRVWNEHFTSQIVRTIVESAYPFVAEALGVSAPTRGRVILACPPAEQHDLGLRMLADRFALGGYEVFYLGTDTPVPELIDAAGVLAADMLILSASTHFHRVSLRAVVEALKTALPSVRVLVGGPAFALDRDWPADELLDIRELGLPGSPPLPEDATGGTA